MVGLKSSASCSEYEGVVIAGTFSCSHKNNCCCSFGFTEAENTVSVIADGSGLTWELSSSPTCRGSPSGLTTSRISCRSKNDEESDESEPSDDETALPPADICEHPLSPSRAAAPNAPTVPKNDLLVIMALFFTNSPSVVANCLFLRRC